MIYLKLKGGLGNQMFQYAAAFALSKELNVPLGICFQNSSEKSENYTIRSNELNKLFRLLNSQEIDAVVIERLLRRSRNRLLKIGFGLFHLSEYYEKSLSYDPEFFISKSPVYIEGYFQSERYFQRVKAEIRGIFTFNQKASRETEHIVVQARNLNSVAIHVRRGDYVSNAVNLSTHGVCSLDYYARAIEEVSKLTKNPVFFCVSDDPEWVIDNLRFEKDNVHYINWNKGNDSWQDMFIMSQCKHAIIANSSFSWWGAYLIDNPIKKIYAPVNWYRDIERAEQTADLIPTSWMRV